MEDARGTKGGDGTEIEEEVRGEEATKEKEKKEENETERGEEERREGGLRR